MEVIPALLAFGVRRNELITAIKSGALFFYPTDTIYGIGCDATNEKAVSKIREIKNRNDKAFSIIPPSKAWVSENCEETSSYRELLSKNNVAYTAILSMVNEKALAPSVLLTKQTVGIRFPKHEITGFVRELGLPIVTTSMNISPSKPLASLENIPEELSKGVMFAIDEGVLGGSPSTLYNCTGEHLLPMVRV